MGAFLAGAAVFQIPAGFAALKWGNRNVSVAALACMGLFCFGSAFSPNWIVLAGLRFGAGAGAAFFFAPALSLVASYFPEGSRGPIVGLYNAGFSLGSGLGIFVGAFLGAALGWSWALAVGGLALFGATAVAPFVLPATGGAPPRRTLGALWRASQPVLRSRPLWALALAFSGLWATFYIAAQYFVQYAHAVHPAWSLGLAAALPTLMIAVEILGGPLGGWLGEHRVDMRLLLVVFGAPAAVAVMLVPFANLEELFVLFAGLGFVDGAAFAVLYLLPTYFPETRGEGLSLGLGLLNAVQICTGSGLAIAFAFVATYDGYTAAWAVAGAVGLTTLPLLLLVPGPRKAPTDGRTSYGPPLDPVPTGRAR